MGVVGEKWGYSKCNVNVGSSMGELKNHVEEIHPVKFETRIAAA